MKSAYELAMERLRASEGESVALSAEQKAELAKIEEKYRAKLAEREIFLNKQLDEALSGRQWEEAEKIKHQIAGERARLEEDREAEKEKVRTPKKN